MRLVVRHALRQRCHDVVPFAAGDLRPWLQADVSHQFPHPQRRLGDESQIDAFTRIEVKHDLIDCLDIIDRRIPRMEFDSIQTTRKSDQSVYGMSGSAAQLGLSRCRCPLSRRRSRNEAAVAGRDAP
jgi:hypothetical protein